jgi:hypothetical protein
LLHGRFRFESDLHPQMHPGCAMLYCSCVGLCEMRRTIEDAGFLVLVAWHFSCGFFILRTTCAIQGGVQVAVVQMCSVSGGKLCSGQFSWSFSFCGCSAS